MTDLEFALVGCGHVAIKHIEAITRVLGARLAAVCDINSARAKAFGDRLDVPAFTEIDAMLRAVPSISVVSVLTPTGYHAEHAIQIAAHRKHVVVEKPMALRLDDADAMIAACERANVRLFVVKQSRYNAPVQRLRRAVDAGRFGKFVMGTVRVRRCRRQDYYDRDDWRGTWELDGGVLANQASHHIDLLTWMMGDVTSVYAKAARQLVDIETEDTAAVLLQFANGALGIIEATTAARPTDLEGSVSILGEHGSVVIGGQSADELVAWRFEGPESEAHDAAESRPLEGHHAFIDNVVRTIRGETTALVDGDEGRRSLEVINAIYESVRSGREVALPYRSPRALAVSAG